ncbi:MAG: type II toxin-antitoxin system RelE/ParE family toxin [Chlamydiales bacterium]|nr:type II toxin-antitoxin system RelE/ParE family toxin [Chlamydiales bacterium]
MKKTLRPLYWIGNSLKNLKDMPEDAQDAFGHALYLAQVGEKHRLAKPLKGFLGAGVLEIVEDFDGNTYRSVYTVRFEEAVYVLHVFQKKSKSGIATPKQEIDLIHNRLKQVEEMHRKGKK